MSRSDFIARLQLRFDWPNDNMAKEVLDFIEELGVQPPRVSNEDFQALAHYYIEPHIYVWDEDLEKNKEFQEYKKKREERRKK